MAATAMQISPCLHITSTRSPLVDTCKVNACHQDQNQRKTLEKKNHRQGVRGTCLTDPKVMIQKEPALSQSHSGAPPTRTSSIESFQKQMQVIQIHREGTFPQHGFIIQYLPKPTLPCRVMSWESCSTEFMSDNVQKRGASSFISQNGTISTYFRGW